MTEENIILSSLRALNVKIVSFAAVHCYIVLFFCCCLSEQSVSAFAPICNPIQCQWGKKALGGYLGPDASKWEVCVAAAVL